MTVAQLILALQRLRHAGHGGLKVYQHTPGTDHCLPTLKVEATGPNRTPTHVVLLSQSLEDLLKETDADIAYDQYPHFGPDQ